MTSYYLIEFKSQDLDLHAAGFEICLALTALDLPLHIIIREAAESSKLRKQLASLSDYGVATIHPPHQLTAAQYEQLIQNPHFFLCF